MGVNLIFFYFHMVWNTEQRATAMHVEIFYSLLKAASLSFLLFFPSLLEEIRVVLQVV